MAYKGILNDDTIQQIQSVNTDIENISNQLINRWTCDIENRKPSPADIEHGKLTDLDLCTFLFTLSKRNAIVEIPGFQSLRPSTDNSTRNQKVVGTTRFGKIKTFTTNEETLNVSLMLDDNSVIDYNENSAGQARNFTITDFDGNLYSGWSHMIFKPDAKENEFIFESDILSDGKIIFDRFVHPNSWIRMFSRDYIKIKIMDQRITAEMSEINKFIKEKASDIKTKSVKPVKPVKNSSPIIKSPKSPSKIIEVEAFVVKVHGINISQEGYIDKYSNLSLVELEKKYNFFRYVLRPQIRFIARVAEIGHYKKLHAIPSWLKGKKWIPGFKETPRSRKYYESLLINDEYKDPIYLLRRAYPKGTEVSIKYNEGFNKCYQ